MEDINSKQSETCNNFDSRNDASDSHEQLCISVDRIAAVVADLWRIHSRARNEAASDRIIASCERAEDRLRGFGFEVRDLTNLPYDTNMSARVLDHEGGPHSMRVLRCLSPAVYFEGNLIVEAEIVTKGENQECQPQ